jgi:signal transduction histidine kinase/DNA-binding response OmpR family regulator
VNAAITFLQNADAIAFALLGAVTAVGWVRRRDRSLGFLALAIVLLSLVTLLGRIPPEYTPPLLPQISLILFMGSGYALLRFRGSLIPIPPKWHAAVLVAIVVAIAADFAAQALVAAKVAPAAIATGVGFFLIFVWLATIVEPTVRFWLVARDLPAVQAWRLRSLSFGFGGLVAVLVIAIGSLAFKSSPLLQLLIQLGVLLIVPLLYVSFSPPSWLRRQWRSSEEEGLRVFMQDTLLLGEDPVMMADQALEWAMRLVGGAAAVVFDGAGARVAARGMEPDQLKALSRRLPQLTEGINRVTLEGVDRTVFVLPIAGAGPDGHLVVLAGPFSPNFGGDELSRVQQFMTALSAAVERARLLTELKAANAELMEANRHKTVFLANMSHELRTPLNSILGFSEMLIDASNGQFPEATRMRFLEQIHSSGKHLLGLINDILDLSKVEAGQMELRLSNVSVAEVAYQVVATAEPLAAHKHIKMELDTSGASQIVADEGKLKQMILNLVSNAIKFTADGGTVTIKAARVADRMVISVADNGIGIAEKDIKRIFTEFQQVDSGANRTQQGTGLGLALTRSFAALHGGEVRVESEPGKGSRFTIDIPVDAHSRRVSAAPVAGVTEVAGDHSVPLVLIVEDDPASAELLARQVARGGFRTKVARNGKDALTMVHALKPDAITIDVLLPDIDGWEILKRLKGDQLTSDIPTILVTVVDNPELGTALGANDYFVKPVDAKELVKRLGTFNFKNKVGGRPTSILVVDDQADNRDWLKHVLEPAGFKVILANGGREGIELARSRQPDLVMLDLVMPDVDGFDVVEALGRDERTKGIPIMIVTAKQLTEADVGQLRGHVATIVERGSVGDVDLLARLVAALNKPGSST